METETQERKRRGNVYDGNGDSTRRKRPRSDERTVSEEEVKEFFTILHRIRDANGCGERRSGDRTSTAGRWRPTFKLEDFEETAATANEVTSGAPLSAVEKEIDLNVAPQPEDSMGKRI